MNREIWRYIQYITFKMDCLSEQEDLGLDVSLEDIKANIHKLENQKAPIIEQLKRSMPKVPIYSVKNKPKVTHKKDGSLSSHGERWFALLKANKLPMNYDGELKIITGYEEPNPGSTPQVKDWLFSLGWEPCTFKYNRNKTTGEEKAVEQVRYSSPSHPKKGELTESVLRLKEKEPGIAALEGITVINHRLGVFEGFLRAAKKREDGSDYVVAGAGGFTNTLRFKHRDPVVNLPKVGKPWGEEIRSIIVSPKGHTFLGSDMSGLESRTRDHYIQPLDPQLVEKSQVDGYDPHLDIGITAGLLTEEEAKFYVWYKSNH